MSSAMVATHETSVVSSASLSNHAWSAQHGYGNAELYSDLLTATLACRDHCGVGACKCVHLHLVADVLLRGGRRPVSQGLYASSLMWHSASTSYLMPTGACASSCFLEAAFGSIRRLKCQQHSTVANITLCFHR